MGEPIKLNREPIQLGQEFSDFKFISRTKPEVSSFYLCFGTALLEAINRFKLSPPHYNAITKKLSNSLDHMITDITENGTDQQKANLERIGIFRQLLEIMQDKTNYDIATCKRFVDYYLDEQNQNQRAGQSIEWTIRELMCYANRGKKDIVNEIQTRKAFEVGVREVNLQNMLSSIKVHLLIIGSQKAKFIQCNDKNQLPLITLYLEGGSNYSLIYHQRHLEVDESGQASLPIDNYPFTTTFQEEHKKTSPSTHPPVQTLSESPLQSSTSVSNSSLTSLFEVIIPAIDFSKLNDPDKLQSYLQEVQESNPELQKTLEKITRSLKQQPTSQFPPVQPTSKQNSYPPVQTPSNTQFPQVQAPANQGYPPVNPPSQGPPPVSPPFQNSQAHQPPHVRPPVNPPVVPPFQNSQAHQPPPVRPPVNPPNQGPPPVVPPNPMRNQFQQSQNFSSAFTPNQPRNQPPLVQLPVSSRPTCVVCRNQKDEDEFSINCPQDKICNPCRVSSFRSGDQSCPRCKRDYSPGELEELQVLQISMG